MPDKAQLVLNLFDGSRRPIATDLNCLIRIIDGNQQQIFTNFLKGPSHSFEVPLNDNLADRYTILASADGMRDAGFYPVTVQAPVDVESFGLSAALAVGQFESTGKRNAKAIRCSLKST